MVRVKACAAAAGLGLVAVLASCSSGSDPAGSPAASQPAAGSTGTASGGGVTQVTAGQSVATGLQVPWGVAFLGDGSALVAQRPTGVIVRVEAGGGTTTVGTVPGVADQGEGGLLGLAFQPASAASTSAGVKPGTLFAYLTSTAGDNRVVRMSFDGKRLGAPSPVLTGIRSAQNHNGGALAIGPGGTLWIGTGDATNGANSQNRASLNGKILRLDLDGSVPDDNPFPGSPVYSLGHRNVQGIAFDSTGQAWADEFGQNTWDELNRITPGGNYGWPTVEGKAGKAGFIDPVVQWHTDDASPSGMTIVDDVAYIGALKGQRLWQVPLSGPAAGRPTAWLQGQFGRIRNVAADPAGGGLWITTSNRDGRGSPGTDDDRVIKVRLT